MRKTSGKLGIPIARDNRATFSQLEYIYAHDGVVADAFARYFRFRWLCSLLECEFSEVHQELMDFFANHPERLQQVHWRGFEKLLDSVFKNNGFRTVLGPGRSDGGIDLRLYSHDAVGEILTLLQAKRYNPKYPITVDAVRSFYQVVQDENANRGLFVTTARYAPAARKFANTKQTRIQLADSNDVSRWCNEASNYLDGNRLPEAFLEALRSFRKHSGQQGDSLIGKILVATTYYGMVLNYFAIVIAETKSGIMAVQIDAVHQEGLTGKETPNVPICLIESSGRDALKAHSNTDNTFHRSPFWAWKRKDHFWGSRHSWRIWNGEPVWYDLMD